MTASGGESRSWPASSLGSHVLGAILGGEFAGVVEQVGDGVTTFSPGERVFRLQRAGLGAHAEQPAKAQAGRASSRRAPVRMCRSADDQPSVTTGRASTQLITLRPAPGSPRPSASIPPALISPNRCRRWRAPRSARRPTAKHAPCDTRGPGNFDPLTASRQGIVTISDESGGYPGDDPLVATITAVTPGSPGSPHSLTCRASTPRRHACHRSTHGSWR
jgi:hypothetical protein